MHSIFFLFGLDLCFPTRSSAVAEGLHDTYDTKILYNGGVHKFKNGLCDPYCAHF